MTVIDLPPDSVRDTTPTADPDEIVAVVPGRNPYTPAVYGLGLAAAFTALAACWAEHTDHAAVTWLVVAAFLLTGLGVAARVGEHRHDSNNPY